MKRTTCHKCGSGLIKKPTRKNKRKAGQRYYFKNTLRCTQCPQMYNDEDSKVWINHNKKNKTPPALKKEYLLQSKNKFDNNKIFELEERIEIIERLLNI